MVEGTCSACHNVSLLSRSSGYDAEGWKALIDTMIDLSGSPETLDEMAEYLAAHFPPNDDRTPVLVPGDAEIAFHEWVVPTLGQRSARSGRSTGRQDLVGRPMGQPDRQHRPGDR